MTSMGTELRTGALAALLAAVALPAAAPAQRSAPPPPAAARPYALPGAVERTLPSGLRVIVAEQADVPLVTAQVVVRSGAEADPAGLSGLADFVATLLPRGTEARPGIQQEAAALGGTLGGTADWDATRLTATAPAAHFPALLDLLAESTLRPALSQRDVEFFNTAAARRAYGRFTQPLLAGEYAAARLLFGSTGYAHPVVGTQEAVQRITREDALRFHATHFRPDNAVLVVAGDIRPEAAFSLAERSFGGWARPSAPLPAPERPKPAAAGRQRVVVVDVPDAPGAAVVLALPGVRLADPEYFPALVAGSVLGGGYTSRLSRGLRAERPLVETVRAWVDARRDAGTLFVSAATSHEAAPEAAALLAAEVSRLAEARATDAELAARRAYVTGSLVRDLQTTEGLATHVGTLAARGVGMERLARFGGELRGVDARDLLRFARARLASAKSQVVMVGRADAMLEEARRRFPGVEVEVVPFAELDLGSETLRLPQP